MKTIVSLQWQYQFIFAFYIMEEYKNSQDSNVVHWMSLENVKEKINFGLFTVFS